VLFMAAPESRNSPVWQALDAIGYGPLHGSCLTAAIDLAIQAKPVAILCHLTSFSSDGIDFLRALRAHPSLWALPLVCVAEDSILRAASLGAGADVALPSSVGAAVIAAQLDALVRFAARFAARAVPAPAVTASGADLSPMVEGDLRLVPASTFLTILSLEGRTGVYEAESGPDRAHVAIAGGKVLDAGIDGAPATALEAVKKIVGFSGGNFAFSPRPFPGVPVDAALVRDLCIEAARLLDEDERARTSARSA
jgi:hypothetical protein